MTTKPEAPKEVNPLSKDALARPSGELKTLGDVLNARRAEFAKLLPKHLSVDKLLKVAINCVAKTPELQKCTIDSVLRCTYACAELGLEPGGALGLAYLVPFGGICTLIVGYRGLIRLCHNSGDVVSVRAVVVREKDRFRYREGLEQSIAHEPFLDGDAGPLVRVYAVALLRSGERVAEFMTRAQVEAIRARSRAGKSGPWVTDFDEMAKKTVTRRLCKYLPMSDEAREHIEKDEDTIDGEVTQRDGEPAERAETKTKKRLNIADAPTLEENLAASVAQAQMSDAEKAEIVAKEKAAEKS